MDAEEKFLGIFVQAGTIDYLSLIVHHTTPRLRMVIPPRIPPRAVKRTFLQRLLHCDQMIQQSHLMVSLYNRMILNDASTSSASPFKKIHSINEFVLSLSKDDPTENRTRIAGLKTQCPNR